MMIVQALSSSFFHLHVMRLTITPIIPTVLPDVWGLK